MMMASREYQHMQNEIKQLKADMANLVMALIELKVFKIKIDNDGQAIYDTGKDEQSEVQ
jgi:hypothetical protein